MSFEGFLRLHQVGTFSVMVAVALIWVIGGIIASKIRKDDPDLAQFALRVRFYIIAVVLTVGVLNLAYSAVSNQTPQAVIDRSDVNRQQDQHEQEVQQKQREAEASQKEKSK